ncbi:MAG: GTPase domain-containing protein [Planctomycetes bacterium]|nr:GTPase domain-containing protein [Planctomycetota bacterium]
MRTLLSRFCDEFGAIVHPLLDPLASSSESLAALDAASPIRKLLPGLRDRTHQLQSLINKVEEQQAYVLIFGPLKSGKSTLMNAIAASYVSEVTTMPAYPCMVFVQHSTQRRYKLTRYDGQVDELHDAAALRMEMNRAHTELVEHIRQIEETGADFDPTTHFPQAIRRLDICVPAEALKNSGTVVVDTPGLYSRMKFGYDQMTREFRDTATCAIFVVKTDNLFLEQVFHEFHELLELFSKIFLVVNLDTTKRDLRPDGSLAPSLESEDPIRLIEAFENFSMSSSLKQAREEGRLKIYPSDLLNAASRRLNDSTPAEAEDGRRATFDSFLGDLKDYLDSDEYLLAFLGDSLRQAENLVAGLRRLLADNAVAEMEIRVRELEADRAAAQERSASIEELLSFEWVGHFRGVQPDLEAASTEEEAHLGQKTENKLNETIEKWFQETSSLKSLVKGGLGSVLRDLQAEIVSTQMAALRQRVHRAPGGLTLPEGLAEQAASCGADLTAIGREAIERIDGGSAIEYIEIPLHKAIIPVKKSFWDWILFRNIDKVRMRVLGAKGEHRLTQSMKKKRMGYAGQTYMKAEAADAAADFLKHSMPRLAKWLTQSYAHFGIKLTLERLEVAANHAAKDLECVTIELEKVAALSASLRSLHDELSKAEGGLDFLSDQYATTNPNNLKLEIEEEVGINTDPQPEG